MSAGKDSTRRTASGVWRGVVAVLVLLGTLVGAPASSAVAHDGIDSSAPADGSMIDEPISSVEIDFGENISEGVSMFLLYDRGDGTEIDIGGDTTKTGETTARLDFPEIADEGTYFARFLAPVPSDGHVIAGAISFSWGARTAAVGHPNPEIRVSTPGSREVVADPITSAEITFNLDIDDDVELQLVYDRGNGVDFEDLASVTTKTGTNTAMVEFDPLERKGTYFVSYDTTSVATGDEIVGATSFAFGSASGEDSSIVPWLVFAPIALIVLGIGALLSYRRMRAPVDDGEGLTGADELSTA